MLQSIKSYLNCAAHLLIQRDQSATRTCTLRWHMHNNISSTILRCTQSCVLHTYPGAYTPICLSHARLPSTQHTTSDTSASAPIATSKFSLGAATHSTSNTRHHTALYRQKRSHHFSPCRPPPHISYSAPKWSSRCMQGLRSRRRSYCFRHLTSYVSARSRGIAGLLAARVRYDRWAGVAGGMVQPSITFAV